MFVHFISSAWLVSAELIPRWGFWCRSSVPVRGWFQSENPWFSIGVCISPISPVRRGSGLEILVFVHFINSAWPCQQSLYHWYSTGNAFLPCAICHSMRTFEHIFSSAWLCQQSSWNRNLSVVCRPSVRPSVVRLSVRPSVRVAIISELNAQISFKF